MERGHAISELTEDPHDPVTPESTAGIVLGFGVCGLLFLGPLAKGVLTKICIKIDNLSHSAAFFFFFLICRAIHTRCFRIIKLSVRDTYADTHSSLCHVNGDFIQCAKQGLVIN